MREMPQRPRATREYFEVAERLPSSMFYWLAIGSIVTSAFFFLIGRRNWSLFVGQWVPTFLILPIFNKILHPSREEPFEQMREATHEARRAGEDITRR